MLGDFDLELFVIIFTAISSFLMGLIVFLRDKKSITNASFLVLTLILSSWSITNYFSLHSSTEETTLFWIRTVMAITAFLGPSLFVFLYTFPERRWKFSPTISGILFLISIPISILSLTPLVFQNVTIRNGNITPIPGPVLPIFMGIFFITTGIGFISIFKKFKKSTGFIKLQIRYLLTGTAISFLLLTLTNLIAVVVLKTSQLVALGPLFPLIMFGFISYAIMRHRLLNITSLIARTVSYTLVFFVASVVYAFLFFITANILFPRLFSNPRVNIIISTVLALAVAFTLPTIRQLIEKVTDKFLYKNKFDTQSLFNKVAETITSTLDLPTLAQQTINLLCQEMRVTYIVAALKRDKDYLFYRSNQAPEKEIPLLEVSNELKTSKQLIFFEELETGSLKDWMQRQEVSVILILEVKGEVIGYLLFGSKASGEIFYDNDLRVLPAIADQLAIAFQNALAFMQISQFNETLKSEVEKATKELSKANEELKVLDKLKDEFLSMASHELKSPMNAIKNYLWMAINKGKDQPERLPEFLTTAYQATQRLIALVNDLLDVSRIESGRATVDTKVINVARAVHDTLNVFLPEAQAKNIELTTEVPEELNIKADEQKLQEVLSNYVSNGIKYTPKGKVQITAKDTGSFIRINVTDTGPGISADDQKKLFQKFSRVNASTKELAFIDGTGLGLFVTKRFAELMGGNVGVSSQVGKGSTFWVELPKA